VRAAGDRLSAPRGALQQTSAGAFRQTRSGLQRVDQEQPDRDRDRRHDDRVGERLEPDASQPLQIAEAEDTEDERREDERDDEHEQQAQEDLAERLG
jgi:hypothetical protein